MNFSFKFNLLFTKRTGFVSGSIWTAKGNLIEESSYDSKDSLVYKLSYKYDIKNNIIGKTMYNSDGSSSFENNKYNTDNYIIEKFEYIGKDYLDQKTTFEYEYY